MVRFTLVDSQGGEHPAAVGVGTGDAHYLYASEPGMPPFAGHNRGEVKEWLEGVIAASQAAAGYTGGEVEDPIPEDPAAAERSLPSFLTFKCVAGGRGRGGRWGILYHPRGTLLLIHRVSIGGGGGCCVAATFPPLLLTPFPSLPRAPPPVSLSSRPGTRSSSWVTGAT